MAAPSKISYFILQHLKRLKNSYTVTFCNYCTIKKSVKCLLETQSDGVVPRSVTTEGWVTSMQKHKKVTFFHMNDGTTSEDLQVICDKSVSTSDLSFGSSVCVHGDLVKSLGKGQVWEVLAKSLEIVGHCDAHQFPIQQEKSEQTNDYSREFLHLRPRSQSTACMLRIRNTATMAIHKYFQDRDFVYVHTPMLSSNDCEGAGEVFQVEPASQTLLEAVTVDDPSTEKQFFGCPAYLTVSGQLHLEAVTGALKNAYSFGPTFRAENQSKGRHHLSEFYMVEGEMAFLDNIHSLMQVMESLLKEITQDILVKAPRDIELLYRHNGIPDHMKKLENILQHKFHVIQYDEAVKFLEKNNNNFVTKVEWGCDFSKQHERYLVKEFGHNIPVFVTDFPLSLKPFYALTNADNRTVSAVDMLVPEVGELFGGSMREHRYEVMKDKLENLKLTNSLQWYLDLRKYGTVPHGGFGMGFERFLQFLTGTVNIKDTIPFPRTPMNCKM